MSFISAVSELPSTAMAIKTGAAAVDEQVLQGTRGGLDGARVAVTVDIGGHDTLAAQPPDVLAEHAAGLGAQLKAMRRHMWT